MDTKNASAKYVIGIIAAVVVIVGVTMLSSNKSQSGDGVLPPAATEKTGYSNTDVKNASAATKTTTALKTQTAPATQTPSGAFTVTYRDSGFSPAALSIKVGDTVKFVNQSSEKMWVASAMHPSHTIYSGTTLNEHCPDTAGTAFDQCGAGDSYSFTFQKAGTWAYHNHTDAGKYGKIVVQ